MGSCLRVKVAGLNEYGLWGLGWGFVTGFEFFLAGGGIGLCCVLQLFSECLSGFLLISCCFNLPANSFGFCLEEAANSSFCWRCLEISEVVRCF